MNPVPINVGLRSGTRTADVDEIGAVCGHGATVSAVHIRVVIVRWAVSATCLLNVVESCAKLGHNQRTKELVNRQTPHEHRHKSKEKKNKGSSVE